MTVPPAGIKKQVIGLVLLGLGLVTALLARIIGFELDSFYIVISVIGLCLFIYGRRQNQDG
jgi:Na+/phosphate symporter